MEDNDWLERQQRRKVPGSAERLMDDQADKDRVRAKAFGPVQERRVYAPGQEVEPRAPAKPKPEPTVEKDATRLENQPTLQTAPDIQLPGGLGFKNGRAGLTENQKRARAGLELLQEAGLAEVDPTPKPEGPAMPEINPGKPGPRLILSLELRPPGDDKRRG